MLEDRPAPEDLVKGTRHYLGHGTAGAGMMLMVTGMAMVASVVLLPVGVVLGLCGLFIFLGELFNNPPPDRLGHANSKRGGR